MSSCCLVSMHVMQFTAILLFDLTLEIPLAIAE